MTPVAAAVDEVRRANGCVDPIRLRGWHERIDPATGELLARVISARQHGGVLVVPCGDRRSAKCPACAETYRHDAFQLVVSGLRGGKGVPDAVAGHPAVMATLTAPSFGRVHTIRDRDGRCPCGDRHSPDDEVLGTPSIRGHTATRSRRRGTTSPRRSGSERFRRSDVASRGSSVCPATGSASSSACAS